MKKVWVAIVSIVVLLLNSPLNVMNAANVTVTFPISAGTLTISAPTSFTFSAINVSFVAQTITNNFSGSVSDYFIVTDLQGLDSGYTTTLQLTGDLVSASGNSISSGSVFVKSLWPTAVLLSGTANPRVIIDSAITGSYQGMNNTRTFIYRNAALNTGVLSQYGQYISMQIVVPASQPAGNYLGTLVYTIIPN